MLKHLFIILFLGLSLHHSVVAQTREELEKERIALKKEIEETEKLLNENNVRTKENLVQFNLISKKVNLQDRVIDNINIDKHIANGEDCLNRNVNTFKSVNFDSYFPKYLLDNKEKYKQFILPDPNPGISVQDFHPRKILELE